MFNAFTFLCASGESTFFWKASCLAPTDTSKANTTKPNVTHHARRALEPAKASKSSRTVLPCRKSTDLSEISRMCQIPSWLRTDQTPRMCPKLRHVAFSPDTSISTLPFGLWRVWCFVGSSVLVPSIMSFGSCRHSFSGSSSSRLAQQVDKQESSSGASRIQRVHPGFRLRIIRQMV